MGLDDGYEASFDFSTLLGKTVDVIFVLKNKNKTKLPFHCLICLKSLLLECAQLLPLLRCDG